MSLADTFSRVRSGLVHILFFNEEKVVVARGTGFISSGFLITNNHVFAGPANSFVWLRKESEGEALTPTSLVMSYSDFAAALVTGSDKNSYDYAVLHIPKLVNQSKYQFVLRSPASARIGEQVALIGFPLEHSNLTCHSGIISSFYKSGLADVIQIDASVNSGNSGGPLIDPGSGDVLGIVTRKGTGLTNLFETLRHALNGNIQQLQSVQGGISIGGINPLDAARASQSQMLMVLDEIERQANVGIGYAMSSDHLLAEPIIQSTISVISTPSV